MPATILKQDHGHIFQIFFRYSFLSLTNVLLSGDEGGRNRGSAAHIAFFRFGQAETGTGKTETAAGRERNG